MIESIGKGIECIHEFEKHYIVLALEHEISKIKEQISDTRKNADKLEASERGKIIIPYIEKIGATATGAPIVYGPPAITPNDIRDMADQLERQVLPDWEAVLNRVVNTKTC